MTLIELVVLALVQGVTEFLPISSSGHLVLVPLTTGWSDQGLTIDIAVHLGTLAAVTLYCRTEVGRAARGALGWTRGARDADARLALNVVIATVPVALVGVAARPYVAEMLRSPAVIAWATIGFGVLLYLADQVRARQHDGDTLRPGQALAIGCAQALALVPGTSRSGVTMTMGRALGLDRRMAARFSFLISIPAIAGAGLLAAIDVGANGEWALGLDAAIAAALAFAAALAAMALLMRWVERHSFTPFVIYRLVLGAALLWWIYL